MHDRTKHIDGNILLLQQEQPNRLSQISNLQTIIIMTAESNMKRIFIIALALLTLVLNKEVRENETERTVSRSRLR